MKKILLFFLIISFFALLSFTQDCGTNCPLCSDSPINTEGMLNPGTILVKTIFAPEVEEKVVSMLKLAAHKKFNLGVGYIKKSEDFLWNARLLVWDEKEKLPGLVIGTNSVRIGGSDQSVFFSATKNFEENLSLPLRITAVAASIVSDFSDVYFIGSVIYLI